MDFGAVADRAVAYGHDMIEVEYAEYDGVIKVTLVSRVDRDVPRLRLFTPATRDIERRAFEELRAAGWDVNPKGTHGVRAYRGKSRGFTSLTHKANRQPFIVNAPPMTLRPGARKK